MAGSEGFPDPDRQSDPLDQFHADMERLDRGWSYHSMIYWRLHEDDFDATKHRLGIVYADKDGIQTKAEVLSVSEPRDEYPLATLQVHMRSRPPKLPDSLSPNKQSDIAGLTAAELLARIFEAQLIHARENPSEEWEDFAVPDEPQHINLCDIGSLIVYKEPRNRE